MHVEYCFVQPTCRGLLSPLNLFRNVEWTELQPGMESWNDGDLPIQCSLWSRRLLFHDGVRLAFRWSVGWGRSTAIWNGEYLAQSSLDDRGSSERSCDIYCTFSYALSTKPACSTNEHGGLILKHQLSCVLVPRFHNGRYSSRFALVQHFHEPAMTEAMTAIWK